MIVQYILRFPLSLLTSVLGHLALLFLLFFLFWGFRPIDPQAFTLWTPSTPEPVRSTNASPKRYQGTVMREHRLNYPPVEVEDTPNARHAWHFIPANEYRYIYQMVDRRLTYPVEFRESNIQGRVSVKLAFTKDGRLQHDRIKVLQSSSNYLRVHILKLFRTLFWEPLPKTQQTFKKPFTLEMSFNFERNEHNDPELIAARSFISGSTLFFYRHEHHSQLSWNLGPLQGLGPFAISVDIQKLIPSGSKPNPILQALSRYRDDPEW